MRSEYLPRNYRIIMPTAYLVDIRGLSEFENAWNKMSKLVIKPKYYAI